MTLRKIALNASLLLVTLALPSAFAQTSPAGSAPSAPTGFDPPTQAPAQTPSVGTPSDPGTSTGTLGVNGQPQSVPAAGGFSTTALPGGLPHVARPIVFTTDRALLYPPIRDFRLASGDAISVRIFGEAEYVVAGRLNNRGGIIMPFLGTLTLEGLTVPEAQALIAAKLEAAGIYRSPEVVLTVTESPKSVATVVGEVNKVIPVYGQKTLIEVLYGSGGIGSSGAAGLPATAGHIVTIDRPGVPEPIVVDLGDDPAQSPYANIPVFAGDTVIVPRAGIIYVVGAFKTNGIYPLSGNNATTMMQLAAVTGGPSLDAKYSDLRLIRNVGDHRTVVRLDIGKILDGKAPDPILQAGDILYLPRSNWKTFLTSSSAGTVLGLASIALTTLSYTR